LKFWSELGIAKQYKNKNWSKFINTLDTNNNLKKEIMKIYDNDFLNIKKTKIIRKFKDKNIVIL
jgi:hypothetical protein